MKELDLIGELQKKINDMEAYIENMHRLIDMLKEKITVYESQENKWRERGRVIKMQ